MQHSKRTNSGLPIACLALAVMVALCTLSQARYLPTRSDESELEVLKGLVANVRIVTNRILLTLKGSAAEEENNDKRCAGAVPLTHRTPCS